MILALLLAQASAVDAERAFEADAQRLGQWTAFRKWAADDAEMFWPQPVMAQEKLRKLSDPAKSVERRTARSFVSCDGLTAANTGPTRWPDGRIGYFSTVWSKGDDRWRWTLDHGDLTTTTHWGEPAEPIVQRAACKQKAMTDTLLEITGDYSLISRSSADDTLRYSRRVMRDGSRRLTVRLWNGRDFDTVIDDQVAAPPVP
jgi:hypothetical protein